jgi:hypothetical protein
MDCVFIGYAYNSSVYQFLVHKSNIEDIHPKISLWNQGILCSLRMCFYGRKRHNVYC